MFSVRKASVLLALVLVLAVAAVAAAQGTNTIQTANNAKYGQILVDSKGMTLYIYTKDTTPNVSTCMDTCLTNWPALTVTGAVTPTAASGITGTLATFKRTDNQATQVSYNGMPLYYFAADKAAGDATGQGVGGVWFVVNPATGPVKTVATAAATGTATTAAATPTATKAATAAATKAATAAPSTLPTTGGTGTADWTLPFLAFVVLFLVAGLGLNLARRTR